MKESKISTCQIEVQKKEFENGAECILSTSWTSFVGENANQRIVYLAQNVGGRA
jgi:hypothetical protein